MDSNVKLVLMAIGLTALIFGSSSAFADSHPQVLGNMTQQERQQLFAQMSTQPNAQVSGNFFIMILKTPAGPELDNFVINSTDLIKLQNNVGIFTVCGGFNNGLCQPPVFTQAQPTNGYCQLAWLIHLNEDGYNNTKVGNSTIFQVTTPPPECSIPVPEFSNYAMLFVISLGCMMIGVISIQRMKK